MYIIDREYYLAHSNRSCDVKIVVPIRFKSYILHSIVEHVFDDGMPWIGSNQAVMDSTTCFISAIVIAIRVSLAPWLGLKSLKLGIRYICT